MREGHSGSTGPYSIYRKPVPGPLEHTTIRSFPMKHSALSRTKRLLAAALFCALVLSPCQGMAASAGTSGEKSMSTENLGPFPKGEENKAYAKYFIGTSYLAPLVREGVNISNVTFEPRCRNNWHVHNATKGGGQILLVTAGRGWYQEWGKEARELKTGDTVYIPAGVKHWHGAAKDSWFVHIAIAVPGENASNDWLEPVTDDQYNKLP